mgnify:CR=1 FL=1
MVAMCGVHLSMMDIFPSWDGIGIQGEQFTVCRASLITNGTDIINTILKVRLVATILMNLEEPDWRIHGQIQTGEKH